MITSTTTGVQNTVNHYKAGTDLYEYLLVVNPDPLVKSRVIAEKESFYNKYRQKVAIKTQPHITVANYLAKEAMEETIERWVQRICADRKSFSLMLNNFSGFPPHTVYIRVQNPQPIQSLLKHLKVIDSYISSNSGFPVKFIDRPHLTIARRLPDEVYTKAMFDYAQRDFNESFVVNELVLLKRKNQFDKCQVINVFKLLPDIDDATYTTQLQMF